MKDLLQEVMIERVKYGRLRRESCCIHLKGILMLFIRWRLISPMVIKWQQVPLIKQQSCGILKQVNVFIHSLVIKTKS